MFKKIFLSLFIMAIVLGLSCSVAMAQEDLSDEIIQADEELEVGAEELDIKEPGIFQWVKNIGWDIQSLITRDPVKKSEIKLKKAGAQLLRARQIVKNNPEDPELQEKLDKIEQRYSELVDDINKRIEEFKSENPENSGLKDFLDKYTNQQIRHQEILSRLEEKVPEAVMERIKEKREEHLAKFGEVMNKLQNKEEMKQSLENALGGTMEKVERRARRMNIIEELGEKASEVKEKIEEFKREQPVLIRQQLQSEWRGLQLKKDAIKEQVRERSREIQEQGKGFLDKLKFYKLESHPAREGTSNTE